MSVDADPASLEVSIMGSWKKDARRRRGAPVHPDSFAPIDSYPAAPLASALDLHSSGDALADLYFGPDPAASPRPRAPSPTPATAPDPRAEQLSAQVADALSLALATAHSAVLRDLVLVAVTPLRGAARLEVLLEAPPHRLVSDAQAAVQRALGWLRGEVADAIERKRVPELVPVVVPARPDVGLATDAADDEAVTP